LAKRSSSRKWFAAASVGDISEIAGSKACRVEVVGNLPAERLELALVRHRTTKASGLRFRSKKTGADSRNMPLGVFAAVGYSW